MMSALVSSERRWGEAFGDQGFFSGSVMVILSGPARTQTSLYGPLRFGTCRAAVTVYSPVFVMLNKKFSAAYAVQLFPGGTCLENRL